MVDVCKKKYSSNLPDTVRDTIFVDQYYVHVCEILWQNKKFPGRNLCSNYVEKICYKMSYLYNFVYFNLGNI